jgi:hypothetical protein
MGVDTHMIAGVRACLTFAPDRSLPTVQPTPHYAGALPAGMRPRPGALLSSENWVEGTAQGNETKAGERLLHGPLEG